MAAVEPSAREPLVFWDLVEESLDEAEFLWSRFERALESPNQRLDDLSKWIEDRLAGSIDGLLAAGAAGVDRVLAPALAGKRSARIAAAAHALVAGASAPGIALVGSTLAETKKPAVRDAIRRGLELTDRPDLPALLAQLTAGTTDAGRAAVLDAGSFRGCFVPVDFAACFSGADVDLQRAAAVHLRCAPAPLQTEWIDRALNHLAPGAQPAAVETALLVGHPSALDACRALASADIAARSEMLLLLGVLGSAKDHERIIGALAKRKRRRAAIWALGFAGRKAGAAACVDLLAQGVETKLAAEALVAITGVDLAGLEMVAKAPPEPEQPIPFEEDDLDADLAGGPEDELPEPDIPAVIRWWAKNQGALDEQTRYLGGRPITFESLQAALVGGPMRRRQAIALELAIRTGGRYVVQTRDFAATQRWQMARFTGLPPEAFSGPFGRELVRAARGR
ncbi:MAG TPA: TIGR02270 family protein [Polyangia bacterium]|nr:TIGR02270 family protein [Polyangia bacterium]